MVEFFPTLEDIKTLRPQPTEGEWTLLHFLKEYFSQPQFKYEPFEVYYQSPLDGGFPDIVILRKNHGVLIIEVKDWNLDLYRIKDSKNWICTSPQGGGKAEQPVKSPIAQANDYKVLFYNTYLRTLAQKSFIDNKMYSLVESAVFFYGSSDTKVREFFQSYAVTQRKNNALTSDWITLLTLDRLQENGLENTQSAYFLLRKKSLNFTEDIYKEMRRVLRPSEYSRIKSLPKNLNAQQRRFATARTGNKIKLDDGKTIFGSKIKGPAGSGKTLVLTYRAVDAYRKTGKPVVILTFNITLCNYIRDCISAALNDLPNIAGKKGWITRNFFIIDNFHEFIRLYRNKNEMNSRPFPDCTLERTPVQYAAILVDEVQDYQRDWMETIIQLVEDGGEVVFFGDSDQDIYERGNMIERVPEITGRWNELKGTFRMKGKIAELARAFQLEFFNGSTGNEIVVPEFIEQDLFKPVEYHFMEKFDIPAVMKIFKDNSASNDDVCILSQGISYVRLFDKALRDRNYPTITAFEPEELYQEFCKKYPVDGEKRKLELHNLRRPFKKSFNMESGRIKLSTIHSYKGWGIPVEILIIGGDLAEDDEISFLSDELVYVGITRAVMHLIIINIGNDKYDKFFSDWVKNNL